MPFIEEKERERFEAALVHVGRNIFVKGELTYCVYKLGVEVMKGLDVSYTNLSMVKSAMNDAADQWFLDKMAPYERKKKKANGDVT